MPNSLVPYIAKNAGFLRFEEMYWVPPADEMDPSELPTWIRWGRELEDIFWSRRREVGNINVVSFTCPWQMHPKDFLDFLHNDRTLWNSRMNLAEIHHVLYMDRLAPWGARVGNTLYFISQDFRGQYHLLEIKRTKGRGFVVESARSITHNSKIDAGKPLYLPIQGRYS